MSDETEKLTPAEFLARLKSGTEGSRLLDWADAGTPDDVDLDFSDLDEPHQPAPAQTATAGDTSTRSHQPRSRAGNSSFDSTPDIVKGDSHLSELFERVHTLLGNEARDSDGVFRPVVPESLEAAGLTFEDAERLILKFLYSKGSATGREISGQVRLSFGIVESIMKQLKREQLVAFKGAASVGDYDFAPTDRGRERAREYSKECTYFGAAPVSLKEYLHAMSAQSVSKQQITAERLGEAFSDLIISDKMLERLGPAINSGRGMFLYGESGNGKTSIAERVTRAFGSTIWIPRALGFDGDILRLYDPNVHEAVEEQTHDGIFDLSGIDQRWVQILRPTVIAGGELTMKELEVSQNLQTKICEAPLQLKSNCGTLVIDDFGRQRMPVDELLNRWIVPLEKRYDFLNLPSGKKVQVPFDQLIIFSTNLEPKDLVDAAFLRRIPYKIEVTAPTEQEFRRLFQLLAPMLGFEYDDAAVDYLIDTHYRPLNRPFRSCQPRDLLQQVKNYCSYKLLPKKLTPTAFDFAVENYFSIM